MSQFRWTVIPIANGPLVGPFPVGVTTWLLPDGGQAPLRGQPSKATGFAGGSFLKHLKTSDHGVLPRKPRIVSISRIRDGAGERRVVLQSRSSNATPKRPEIGKSSYAAGREHGLEGTGFP